MANSVKHCECDQINSLRVLKVHLIGMDLLLILHANHDETKKLYEKRKKKQQR
jgi:hypothetical protein